MQSSSALQQVNSLVNSHPLCSYSLNNWNQCNDLTQATSNLLNTYTDWTQNISAIGDNVRNNLMSVGGAHTFVAFNNTIAYADPFLSNTEGVYDPIVSFTNCTRYWSNADQTTHVCFRTLTNPTTKKTWMSVVVGNGTLTTVTAPNGRRRSCIKSVAQDTVTGGA